MSAVRSGNHLTCKGRELELEWKEDSGNKGFILFLITIFFWFAAEGGEGFLDFHSNRVRECRWTVTVRYGIFNTSPRWKVAQSKRGCSLS